MRTLTVLGAREASRCECPWCHRTPPRASRAIAAVRDGRRIGLLVLAPAEPERDLCAPGASVIEQLWVSPDDVGEHVGTQLLQRACAILIAEHGRCLIAYGSPYSTDCRTLPATWLAKCGFTEHVDGVQWRIDLNRTAPWASRISDAFASVVRSVRPGRPQTASRNKL